MGSLAGSAVQFSGRQPAWRCWSYQLVNDHGLIMAGRGGLIAGGLQLLGGHFPAWGSWFRAISPSVIPGMLTESAC